MLLCKAVFFFCQSETVVARSDDDGEWCGVGDGDGLCGACRDGGVGFHECGTGSVADGVVKDGIGASAIVNCDVVGGAKRINEGDAPKVFAIADLATFRIGKCEDTEEDAGAQCYDDDGVIVHSRCVKTC